LTSVYTNTKQYDLATAAAQRGFDLRNRVSEREKLYASWAYYSNVTYEWDKVEELLELWKRTYPNDWVPHNQLAYIAGRVPFEKAIDEGREAIRLNPNAAPPRGNLASAYIGLDRFDEARKVIQEAFALKLESATMHSRLYLIASVQGDTAAMQQQLAWYTGRPEEYLASGWQAQTAAFA